MGRKEKLGVEYRYYEMPENSFIIALNGPAWVEVRRDDRPHYHNYLEIGYCHMGEGTMVIGGEEFSFSKGYFIVIPPGIPHMTLNTVGVLTQWEYIYLAAEGFLKKWCGYSQLFAEEILHRINGGFFCRNGQEHGSVVRLILQIMAEMQAKGPYYKEKSWGMALAFLMEIARMNREAVIKLSLRERDGGIVSQAVDYVSIYYGQHIRAADLAARCCVSESYFRQIFGEVMHMTPMKYVNLVRIHMACRLLEKTEDTVADIAEQVGMPSLATFSRNFKTLLGMSPGSWRKNRESFECRPQDYRVAVRQGWERDWLWNHTMDLDSRKRKTYEG